MSGWVGVSYERRHVLLVEADSRSHPFLLRRYISNIDWPIPCRVCPLIQTGFCNLPTSLNREKNHATIQRKRDVPLPATNPRLGAHHPEQPGHQDRRGALAVRGINTAFISLT